MSIVEWCNEVGLGEDVAEAIDFCDNTQVIKKCSETVYPPNENDDWKEVITAAPAVVHGII